MRGADSDGTVDPHCTGFATCTFAMTVWVLSDRRKIPVNTAMLLIATVLWLLATIVRDRSLSACEWYSYDGADYSETARTSHNWRPLSITITSGPRQVPLTIFRTSATVYLYSTNVSTTFPPSSEMPLSCVILPGGFGGQGRLMDNCRSSDVTSSGRTGISSPYHASPASVPYAASPG